MRERLQPGAIIDGFRVGEYLHKGGTGYIYHVTAQPEKDPGFPIVMKAPVLPVPMRLAHMIATRTGRQCRETTTDGGEDEIR